MATSQIIILGCTLVFGCFFQLFRKYIDGIYPDNVKWAKGIRSYLIKIGDFTASFLLPIGSIVYYMIKVTVVDKWFVFDIVILTAVLVNNFILMMIRINADIARRRADLLQKHVDALRGGVETHDELFPYLNERLIEARRKLGLND